MGGGGGGRGVNSEKTTAGTSLFFILFTRTWRNVHSRTAGRGLPVVSVGWEGGEGWEIGQIILKQYAGRGGDQETKTGVFFFESLLPSPSLYHPKGLLLERHEALGIMT